MGEVISVQEIVQRRFGRDFEKPCENPDVLECALWDCQVRGRCAGALPSLRRRALASEDSSDNG